MSDIFNHEADAWGSIEEDEDEDEDEEPGEKSGYQTAYKTCRYCGAGELSWASIRGRWLLVSKTHKLHSCAERRQLTAVDEFKRTPNVCTEKT